MNNIQRFIETMEMHNLNSAKVYKHVFNQIDEDIKSYNKQQIVELIEKIRPNSPKHIITICYVFGAYAKWLYEQNINDSNELYNVIQDIDKNALWGRIKEFAPQKFISYKKYIETIADIETFEEYNTLYFKTLFQCVFEGIYNEDLSVIKNLRSSDVENNVVTLKEDNGDTYKIRISYELARNLKLLATTDVWERPNRYGICRVEMRGLYNDSVFKIENRSTANDESYKHTLYSKLRKIAKEYIGYPILPLQLYTSGIMYRIKYLLFINGISFESAFANNSRDRMAHTIIEGELHRCNNKIAVSNFREMVKGYLDVFVDDSFENLSDDLFEDFSSMIEKNELTEFNEGEEKLLEHLSHERNLDVVVLAKKRFKDSHQGRIFCENCGFDFYLKYGERGEGFIEAHHIKPVSEMEAGDVTRVEDLVLLCSNCHSIVHIKKPWLNMEQLKEITQRN